MLCLSLQPWSQQALKHSLIHAKQVWVCSRAQVLVRCKSQEAAGQQPHTSVSQAALVDVPGMPSTLMAAWRKVYQDLLWVVQQQHAPNRKARIKALGSDMQAIMNQVPLEVAHQLEQQLINGRIAAKKLQAERLAAAYVSGPQVVVDCSFAEEHCRPGLERRSLAKQVEWAMAVNRRAGAPLGLHATSWTGEVQQFGEHINCKSWPVKLYPEPLAEVFDLSRAVIMSPDATEPLLNLDPHAVYVVGGIIDRTIKKGVTASFAVDRGLQCRRLPIAEFAAALGLDQQGVNVSPVLNVSDVAIALIDFNHSRDWVSALDRVIPARKRRAQQVRVKKFRPTWTPGNQQPG